MVLHWKFISFREDIISKNSFYKELCVSQDSYQSNRKEIETL